MACEAGLDPEQRIEGKAIGRCRSGAVSVMPRAKSTWRGRPLTPRIRSSRKSRRPPKFPNSSSRVREHDPRRCADAQLMSVGNVVPRRLRRWTSRYAQPVGGVIALREADQLPGVASTRLWDTWHPSSIRRFNESRTRWRNHRTVRARFVWRGSTNKSRSTTAIRDAKHWARIDMNHIA